MQPRFIAHRLPMSPAITSATRADARGVVSRAASAWGMAANVPFAAPI
jgi:hypothetical protein